MVKTKTTFANAKAPAAPGKLGAAIEKLRGLALAGNANAAREVGDAYYWGKGADQISNAARDWYLYSAELGDADSMVNAMAFLREGGGLRNEKRPPGVPAMEIDLQGALLWARRAQAQGRNVGDSHIEGLIAKAAKQGQRGTKPVKPADRKAQRAQIVALAKDEGLGRIVKRLEGSMRDSIRLSPIDAKVAVGGSRLGGKPDLPVDAVWPAGPKQRPLSFMAQLDLASLTKLDSDKLLPKNGLLSFFWDAFDSAWGLSPAEQNCVAVLYTKAGTKLLPRTPPKTLKPPHKYSKVVFTPRAVQPAPEVTLPFVRTPIVRGWKLDAAETDSYWQEVYGKTDEIWPTEAGPYHRVLGHADAVQGDMGRRMSYMFAGKSEAIDKKPIAALETDAAKWVLLLQIDTDEALGSNWGEGRLYFWIRSSDLKAKRFDHAWFQFQQ